MTQVTTKLHVILLLYDAWQRGGGSAEQSHRCVFRGPQPVAYVHEHGAKAVQSGCSFAVNAAVGHYGFAVR